MGEELTPLQQQERSAMCGDRQSVLRVVGGLRSYRDFVRRLLDSSDPWLILRCEGDAVVQEIESDGSEAGGEVEG